MRQSKRLPDAAATRMRLAVPMPTLVCVVVAFVAVMSQPPAYTLYGQRPMPPEAATNPTAFGQQPAARQPMPQRYPQAHNPYLDFLPDSGYLKLKPHDEAQPPEYHRVASTARADDSTQRDFSIYSEDGFGRRVKREPVKPLDHPRYVPFVVKPTIANDVTWQPPPEEREPPVYVSTADTVEVPVAPRGTNRSPKRRIVAYDDGDPFAFPVREMAPPPPDSGPPMDSFSVADLSVVHTTRRLVLLTPDRTHAFTASTLAPGDGWSSVPVSGNAPTYNDVVTRLSDKYVASFVSDRVFVLSLDGMAWRTFPVDRFVAFRVTWAHLVDDATLYIRSDSAHALVSWTEGEGGVLRFTARHLRSAPSDDPLTAVPLAPGVAMARLRTHTWVYAYNPKAFNWLPNERIEYALPRGVRLRNRVFFLAEERPGSDGLFRGTGVVATMNAATMRVHQAPTQGEVRVMLQYDEILCLAPSGRDDNCVVCFAADLASYVVLEVDRWEKIKGYVFSGADDTDGLM